MDLLTLGCLLYFIFMLAGFVLVFVIDSDIPTFLAEHFGTKPAEHFREKVVWLTGCSSGIGEAMAKELAGYGTRLVLTARRENELQRVKKECLKVNTKLQDKDILILPMDMTGLSKHESSFKKILDHFGKLDILISNAGRSQRANWEEVEIDVDKELFELNVFSVVNMNRIVLRHFLKVGKGQFAIVSSIAGKLSAPQGGTYSASKHAIQGYFDGLRHELYGKNIDITLILPGPVHSDISNNSFSDKLGERVDESKFKTLSINKMTAERCSQLSFIAMANRINETWMALRPYVAVLYVSTYQPYIFMKLRKFATHRFSRKR